MSDDPELKRNNDYETRGFRRELLVVAILVGLFILVGAIWTAVRGPQPIPGAHNMGVDPLPPQAAPER